MEIDREEGTWQLKPATSKLRIPSERHGN
jgi:hypothetical protein